MLGIVNCEVVELLARFSGSKTKLDTIPASEVAASNEAVAKVGVPTEVAGDTSIEVVGAAHTEVVGATLADVVSTIERGAKIRGTSGDCSLAATSGVGTRGFSASATSCSRRRS